MTLGRLSAGEVGIISPEPPICRDKGGRCPQERRIQNNFTENGPKRRRGVCDVAISQLTAAPPPRTDARARTHAHWHTVIRHRGHRISPILRLRVCPKHPQTRLLAEPLFGNVLIKLHRELCCGVFRIPSQYSGPGCGLHTWTRSSYYSSEWFGFKFFLQIGSFFVDLTVIHLDCTT